MRTLGPTGILCLAATVLMLWYGASDASTDSSKVTAVASADEAVKLALEYTGFDQIEGFTENQISEPVLIIADHDPRSPVAVNEIKGRSAWLVVFQGIILRLPGTIPRVAQKEAKDVSVLIDAETGRLLKVYYVYSSGNEGVVGDPWADLYGTPLPADLGNRLAGRPVPISLCEALRLRFQHDPFTAREFEATCVEFDWPDPEKRSALMPRDSVPVWLVVTRYFWVEDFGRFPGKTCLSVEQRIIDVSTDEGRLVTERTNCGK